MTSSHCVDDITLRRDMDKFLICAVVLFAAAVACSLASLFSPQWIVSEFAGTSQFGLFYGCFTTPGSGARAGRCELSSPHGSWVLVSVLIAVAAAFFMGGASLFLAAMRKGQSTRRPAEQSLIGWGKWTAFMGTLLLCLAGITFPAGFASDELGGRGYLLPRVYTVGYSFYLFLGGIVVSMVGQVAANRLFVARIRNLR